MREKKRKGKGKRRSRRRRRRKKKVNTTHHRQPIFSIPFLSSPGFHFSPFPPPPPLLPPPPPPPPHLYNVSSKYRLKARYFHNFTFPNHRLAIATSYSFQKCSLMLPGSVSASARDAQTAHNTRGQGGNKYVLPGRREESMSCLKKD